MILFWDGFDYLTGGNDTRKWDNDGGSATTGVYGVGSARRVGGQKKTLSTNYSELYASFHFYTENLSAATVYLLRDAGTAQCDLRMNSSGALFFTRSGTTLGSPASTVLVANTWYWMVVRFVISDTVGVAEVKVNGTSYVSLSSQDTKNTANATANLVEINTGSGGQAFDNFLVWDTTSGSGNDLTGYPSGEVVVDTSWVTGAGNNAQWTPLSSTNASNVDETNADDDTTYNSSLTANQIDDFAVGNLHATSATVIGVGVNTIDRVDDATLHTVSHHVESAAAVANGTAFSVSGSYVNHQTLFTLDPNTSAAWTVSGRNAAKFGYKLIS